MLYNDVIKNENIAEFRVFDYKSLEEVGLDLFDDFITTKIYKFCRFSYDYYPEMVREFYSNIYVEKENMILNSYVNGVDILVDKALLA